MGQLLIINSQNPGTPNPMTKLTLNEPATGTKWIDMNR